MYTDLVLGSDLRSSAVLIFCVLCVFLAAIAIPLLFAALREFFLFFLFVLAN